MVSNPYPGPCPPAIPFRDGFARTIQYYHARESWRDVCGHHDVQPDHSNLSIRTASFSSVERLWFHEVRST